MNPRVDVADKTSLDKIEENKTIDQNEYEAIALFEQEAHPKAGQGETPPCLIRKRCQYSSLEKFEVAFDTALHYMKKRDKRSRTNDKVGKVCAAQQLVGTLVLAKIGIGARCAEPSNLGNNRFRPIQMNETGYPDKDLCRRTLRSPGLEHLVGSWSLSLTWAFIAFFTQKKAMD